MEQGAPDFPRSGLPEVCGSPLAVLDTNVVLDWLVFADVAAAPLARALESGAVHWVGSAAMLEELAVVVRRPALARWHPQPEVVLARAQACCRQVAEPPPRPAGWPVCRDPADQKFFDLAVVRGARWLVTRDRALLHLRRAAARQGVTVCTPAAWAAGHATGWPTV